MRCKPGDLAVVVAPRNSKNTGVIVEVLCRAYPGDLLDGHCLAYRPTTPGPHWLVRSIGRLLVIGLTSGSGELAVREAPVSDSRLRPIRDSDGTDETLTDVFRPAPVVA